MIINYNCNVLIVQATNGVPFGAAQLVEHVALPANVRLIQKSYEIQTL
jgi:hypothetical protein